MDWVAFDTETTGLGAEARPVEIGARRFNADGTRWDFETLIDPGMRIPRDVQRIHGITDAMVEGAPSVREGLERFFTFAEGCALVAHNAAFDAGIVGVNASRVGLRTPALMVHDSVRLARRALPHLWSYRLASLARFLHVEVGVVHRALPDALLVGGIVERLRGSGAAALEGFPMRSHGFLGWLSDFAPPSSEIAQERLTVTEVSARG